MGFGSEGACQDQTHLLRTPHCHIQYFRKKNYALTRIRLDVEEFAVARQSLMPVLPQNADSNLLSGDFMCGTHELAGGLPHLPKVERRQRVRHGPNRPELARLHALAGVCESSAGFRKQAEGFAAQAWQSFDVRPKSCAHFRDR